MRLNTFSKALITVILFAITGCGGGGGGAGGGGTTATTVSGVASKGLLNGATVSIFAVDSSGNKSTLLTTTTTSTDGTGKYNATLTNYSGPVLVEVTNGSYKDEATGATTNLSIPLRAAFNVPAGTTTVSSAVTALTEIAVQQMEQLPNKFVAANATSINKIVSDLFVGGTDIITTMPVDVTAPAAGATLAQKGYALLLAAVSQKLSSDKLSNPTTTLQDVLTALSSNIDTTSKGFNDPSLITTPLNLVTNNTSINGTGITSSPISISKAVITVSIPTLPTGRQVAGVDLTIQLPSGVSPAVLSGNDATGSLSLIGGAAGSIPGASYDNVANTIKTGNITTNSFGAGDFLIINCLINSNATVSPSGFSLLNASVIDFNGSSLGVTPTISVTFL